MNSKQLTSILLTTILVLSMFVALVPTASAVDSVNSGNYGYIPLNGSTFTVLIGENLRFNTSGDPIVGESPSAINGKLYGSTKNTSNYVTSDYMSEEGTYNITNGSTVTKLSVEDARLSFDITDTGGTNKISTMTRDESFKIDIGGNIPSDAYITVNIIDPEGTPISADANGNVTVNRSI